ncbi:unnamed protein product [Ilex paraguariensis]|uniref:Uncharacterized protein n=1 Tax=Ilex paraguariensis TaxID=185542 RepID=A0ABC8TW92_9AQUA
MSLLQDVLEAHYRWIRMKRGSSTPYNPKLPLDTRSRKASRTEEVDATRRGMMELPSEDQNQEPL